MSARSAITADALHDAPDPGENTWLRHGRILLSLALAALIWLPLSGLLYGDPEAHYTYRAGRPLIALFFFAPAIPAVLLILTFGFGQLDRLAARSLKRTRRLTAWITSALVLGGLIGLIWSPIGVLAVFLSVYWLLTGRLLGRRGWTLPRHGVTSFAEKLYVLFIAAIGLGLLVPAASKLLPKNASAGLGVPAFAPEFERNMTPVMLAALQRFPDPQSCLEDGADAKVRADLVRVDWTLIRTTPEAEVCTFRLLKHWGNYEAASQWFVAQGFAVSSGQFGGKLRVDGSWKIREKGPKFPTRGVIPRLLGGMAWSMSVSAIFEDDGSELRHVRIGFTTL